MHIVRLLRLGLLLLLLALLLASLLLFAQPFGEKRTEINYTFFHQQVAKGNVSELEIRGQQAYGEFRIPPLKSELESTEKAKSETPSAESCRPRCA